MVTAYIFPDERAENRGYGGEKYREKADGIGNTEMEWFDAAKVFPPEMHEVLATDGKRVKEAWMGKDKRWMRVNETWERVYGQESHVTLWAMKPAPPGMGEEKWQKN